METIYWTGEQLFLLDQTRLPLEAVYVECKTADDVAAAIRSMQVRGAPAIGAAAAFGMALAAKNCLGQQDEDFYRNVMASRDELAATRPTAFNLFWALNRMEQVLISWRGQDTGAVALALVEEARAIYEEDVAMNRRIGEYGFRLVPREARILTHCNAGALATAGFGTALGVIRAANRDRRVARVWVDETRPLLQGARLTAWEMVQERIPATLIVDNMAASLMQQQQVDLVIVGADRITASGDVANKIGTYGLAVLAHYHGIPFYVAAPWSTIDLGLISGSEIPIEERAAEEISVWNGRRIAPEGVEVFNPAFDVTPNQLITAIITDRGILRPPYLENIIDLAGKE